MKLAFERVITWIVDALRRLWAGLRRRPWLAALAVPLLPAAYVLALVPFTPGIADIQKAKSEQPTLVLSADGKELAVFKRANRDWVKLADISPHAVTALIATEDHRFFDHHGIDIKRTASAMLRTLGGDREGGSTITQQLARNLYPEEIGRAVTITRKVKEAITALKIEAIYTKNEILETYLNTVPFLYNAYGIEMAAQTYYDKPAGKLDVLESATLIGMLKGTSYYNPVLNPERATQRRNIVLGQMVKHGKLEAAKLEAFKTRPLALNFERQQENLGPAPHVTQNLRRWLIEWADRNGYNIHADGLVVHTTIDSRLQALATEAVTRQADKLQAMADAAYKPGANKQLVNVFLRETAEYKAARDAGQTDAQAIKSLQSDPVLATLWQDKTRLQAGFLALDPGNGHVKAWVGSRDFNQDQFDHVQQARRQPGSTFKPFVYGAALEQGISPQEAFIDQEIEIRIDERTVWKPGDVGEPSGLPMSMRDGLIQSKNTITAQVMQRVGPSRVAKVAYDMGVRQSKLDPVPSLALGTSPVTLKEMVSAYGTIANSGGFIEPMLVTRIENRNRQVLQQFHPRAPEQGLSAAAAQTLLDVMRGVIDKGTGAGIRSRYGVQGDVAGKTGTTQDNTDGWFILMHPQLVGGAWVGFNDNRVTMRGDAWGQGARNALHIVGDFYQHTLKAKLIDPKAVFSAPHQPAGVLDPLLGRVNDWLSNVFQTPPEGQAPQPAVVVIEPPSSPNVIASEPPAAVLVPPPGRELPAPRPDFQWIPERQGPTDYQRTPGLAPAPEFRRAPDPDRAGPSPMAPVELSPPEARTIRPGDRLGQIVIQVPNQAPLEPRRETSEGVRILRMPPAQEGVSNIN